MNRRGSTGASGSCVSPIYSKSENYTWNKIYTEYSEEYSKKYYKFSDNKGQYRLSDLTGSGIRNGESGKEWNAFNPTNHGRHWAIPKMVKDLFDEKDLTTHQWLELFNSNGMVEMTGKGEGWPHVKRYMEQMSGQLIQDIVTDIPPLSKKHSERLGYPTQKPLALLERIVQASSNEGDVVLDPFCGCGTAVHAAHKLGRQWIGIDITHLAIALIEYRLKSAFKDIPFDVKGTPKDWGGARNLADRDKYQFQYWACSLVGAQPWQNKKKGADGGIDGVVYFQDELGKSGKPEAVKRAIVSVKGGDNVSVAMIRDVKGVMERENAAIGLFVTLKGATKPMLAEAAAAGFYASPAFPGQSFPKLQILTVQGLLDGTERPQLPLDLSGGTHTFKQAKREGKQAKQEKLDI